jgi:hypothetical protein
MENNETGVKNVSSYIAYHGREMVPLRRVEARGLQREVVYIG